MTTQLKKENTTRSSWLATLTLYFGIITAPSGILHLLLAAKPTQHFLSNKGGGQIENSLAYCSLASAVMCILLTALFASIKRCSPLESIRQCNERMFCLLTLPLITLLATPSIEEQRPLLAIFCALLIGSIVTFYLYKNAWIARCIRAPSQRFCFWALLIGTILFAYALYVLSAMNTRALHIASYDLAIYHNLIWNTIRGNFLVTHLMKGGTHMSGHFDPFLALLGIPYLFKQDVFTIIAIQSFWISATALPLYFLNRLILGSPTQAAILAFAFLLHPALHGIGMYEFHSIAFVTPIIVTLILLLERRQNTAFALLYAAGLTIREDVSIIFAGIALIAWDSYGKRKLSLLCLGMSAAYLAIAKLFFMADAGLLMKGKDAYNYASHFSGMIPATSESGALAFLTTLLSNTEFVFSHALEGRKGTYLLMMLSPLLFSPLFSGKRIFVLAYPFIFTLLSTTDGPTSMHKQYNSFVLPFLWALAPFGIIHIVRNSLLNLTNEQRKTLQRALVFGIVCSTLAFSSRFGVLLTNRSFKAPLWPPAHFLPEREQKESFARYEALQDLVSRIPDNVSVEATRLALPFLGNRERLKIFRPIQAEYLLLRPSVLKGKLKKKFDRALREGNIEAIAKRDEWILLKNRRPSF